MASRCGSTGAFLSAHQSIGVPQPLLLFGTDEQKKEFETQSPANCATKTYDALAQQLTGPGNEERYGESKGPDDMD